MNNASQQLGNSYYKKTAKNYLNIRKSSKEWVSEQTIVKQLVDELPENIKVLDIPFGTGRFVEYYLKKNMQVYGLEISQEMLKAASKAIGPLMDKCKITIGDATKKLPFDDKVFDLIVCFRFLKFFSYNVALNILNEFQRVSKSKVLILVNICKEQYSEQIHDKEYLDRIENIGGNLFESDIFKMFECAGFKIEKAFDVEMDPTFKGTSSNLLGKILMLSNKAIKHIKKGTLFNKIINKYFKGEHSKLPKQLLTKIYYLQTK